MIRKPNRMVELALRKTLVANVILLILLMFIISLLHFKMHFSALEVLKFIIFIVWFTFLPGYIVLAITGFLNLPIHARFLVAIVLGLAMLCYFSWLLCAIIGLPYYTYVSIASFLNLTFLALRLQDIRQVLIRGLARNLIEFKDSLRSTNMTIVLGLLIISILCSFGVMKNGLSDGNYLHFYSTAGEEGLWHLGNIAYLKRDLAFADIHQNGHVFAYHFFIYIFLAICSNVSLVEIDVLFFKFLPGLNIFLFLWSCYLVGTVLFRSKKAGMLCALLSLFLDDIVIAIKLSDVLGLEWLRYFYIGPKITPVFLNGPTFIIGVTLFLTAIVMVSELQENENRGRFQFWFALIISGFLFGTIVGFKANIFVAASISLALVSLLLLVTKSSLRIGLIGCVALITSFPLLVHIVKYNSSELVFNPIYFFRQSSFGKDILQLGTTTPAWFMLPIILLAYLTIELGPRLISLKYFKKDLSTNVTPHLLLWSAAIVGVTLSLTFVPAFQPYNTMYFHRFGSVCLSIFLGRTLWQLTKLSIPVRCIALVIIPIYLAGGFYTFFRPKDTPSLLVSVDKVEGLRGIRSHNPDQLNLIISNTFTYGESSQYPPRFYLYSAYSENMVLSEGEEFSPIRFMDRLKFDEIRNDIELFFSTVDTLQAKTILDKWDIDYIIVDLEYGRKLHFDTGFLKQLYRNDTILVYSYQQPQIRVLQ